jgi:hypothetical protein
MHGQDNWVFSPSPVSFKGFSRDTWLHSTFQSYEFLIQCSESESHRWNLEAGTVSFIVEREGHFRPNLSC